MVPEKLQNAHTLAVDGLHGAQQRRLLIQRLAAVGAERRGDAERPALEEGVGGRVPGGVAPRLEGGAQAAGGKAGSIRLALNQLLAGELQNDAAVRGGRNEAVVLLGSHIGHGLEPVGKVGRAPLHRPVPHGVRHRVSNGRVEALAPADGLLEGMIDLAGEPRFHRPLVKYQRTKIIGNACHIQHPFIIKITKKKRRLRECKILSETPLSQCKQYKTAWVKVQSLS